MKNILPLIVLVITIFTSGCNSDKANDVNENNIIYEETSSSSTSNTINTLIDENASEAKSISLSENTVASKKIQNNMIDIEPLCQYPELPTGCEVTSLTAVLNYYGFSCDKCDISDNYLEKGNVGTVDFREYFEGDPRDSNSYGCYAPVIVNAANKYLSSNNSKLKAIDISGNNLDQLFSYININIPVIVWGTQDCQEGHYSVTWYVNGEELTWFTPEHCMVLIGYDTESVWVVDPIYGDIRSYPIDTFARSYNSLFKQAVIIK